MVPYRETIEDGLLLKPFRIYNGVKIDIRWSGGWLTPEGIYHPIDYANGITHATLAGEFGNKIGGSGSIISSPPMIRLFDIAKWIRITYFESSSFCVELKDAFVEVRGIYSEDAGGHVEHYDRRRQTELLRFVNDYRSGFEAYFINDTEYKKYHEFVSAIKDNVVTPTGYSLLNPVCSVANSHYTNFMSTDRTVDAKVYDDLLEDENYGIPTFMRNKQ
jgi:hypothetical protein